jgi:tetratricopeptide (TPR) repeat protein
MVGPHLFAQAAAGDGDSPERQRALELYDHFKMADAAPLLQKLAEQNPKDIVIWERLGMATLCYAATLPTPEERKAARVKAREAFLKAKDLGDESNLVKLVNSIPPDGGEGNFSNREEVNDAMQEAEAAFARGDFDKAVEGYQQALVLDPKMYEAALFTGDVYFKEKKQDLAGEWFERAIKINPDRETAYRYWGDALMQQNKMDEARTKFVEAVVAEPYAERAWVGLSQWAEQNGMKLRVLKLNDRSSSKLKDGKVTVTMDESGDDKDSVGAAWLAYSMDRALWQGEEFKKKFPNETEYRHTAGEEAHALHTMVAVLADLQKKDKLAISPDLGELMRIDAAGLTEAYVYIGRADESIAKDYAAFKAKEGEKVRRYINEFAIVGGKAE